VTAPKVNADALRVLLPIPPVREAVSIELRVSVPLPVRVVLVRVKLKSPDSTTRSVPEPPFSWSLPVPPVRMSLLEPPVNVSLPAPPSRVTEPAVNADALSVLLPTPPVREAASIEFKVSVPRPVRLVLVSVKLTSADSTTRSVPAPPFSWSLPEPPVNVSLPAPPSSVTAPRVNADALRVLLLTPPVREAVSIEFKVSVPRPVRLVLVSVKLTSADSTTRSVPAPPFSWSLPEPSVNVSLPAPPSSVTAPRVNAAALSVLLLFPPVREAVSIEFRVSVPFPVRLVLVRVKLKSPDSMM
jgi:hypothetical protein